MIPFGLMYLIGCESDKGVVVYNTPPTAQIISHDNGSEVFEGYPVEFRAVLSDVNHEIDELTARWKINGEEVCPFLPPDQSGESVCVVTINEGDEEVLVEVRDPENSSGDEVINLIVIPTEAPIAQIISPEEGGVFYSDHLIAFRGKVFDAEDEVGELVVRWESSEDGELDIANEVSDSGEVDGATYLSAGGHYIRFIVEDTTGKTTTASTTIRVGGPNSNPTCEIVAPSSGIAVPSGDLIHFEGFANDVDIDDNLLSVEWTSDKMEGVIGTSSPNSSGEVLFSYSDLTVDTHTIAMTVFDEKGSTCSDNIIVTIGTPPSVIIDSPTGGTYNEGETITFSGTVSDNEDQPNELSLEWTTSDGTILNSQSATSDGNVEFVLTDMGYGQQVVTLTGTDTDGLTSSDLVSFIINALPTQPSLTIIPENPKTGDDITATATGSTDADGGNVTYSYEWVYGSNTVSGSTLSSSETTKGQEWTVTATPNDGTADGPSVSQTVIIGNTAPDNLVVTITPNTGVYNDSELTCSATANDVDTADSLEYTYEWSTGETTETIILDGTLNPTESITCTATVTDGTDSISDTTSATPENRLPVVDSISITPDSVNVGEHTFNCEVETSDADGDDVVTVYEWTIDGTPQQENSNMLSGNFTLGMVIICRATPNDGVEDGNVASADVTIRNAKPFVDSVTLSPETVYTNDTITTTALLLDSDSSQSGDLTAIYSWHVVDVDGNDVEVQSGTDNTLSGVNHFDRDEEVYVVVIPNDGVEDGNTTTSTPITIANTPPVINSITLSPEPATIVDDLVCDANVSDDDGDDLFYTYVWSNTTDVQQTTTEVPDPTDTYLASGLNEGTWTCDVTPYDGTDYGLGLDSSVAVDSGCYSLEFDGNNDSVIIENVNLPTGNQSRTIAVRYMIDSDMSGNLFSYGSGLSVNTRFSLTTWSTSITGNVVSLRFVGESNDYFVVGTTENKWGLAFIRFDGTTLDLWSDGIQQDSVSTSLNTASGTKLMIGTNTEDRNDEFFNGKIRDLAIWDSALSDTEIQQLYSSYDPVNYNGIVGFWNLSEGSGSTVYDSSGNGYDGTIDGATWVNTCPEEDLDEDGVPAWEDCDDNDSSVTYCEFSSCLDILNSGQSTGDGFYSMNPDGNGVIDIYCDMTVDGGGWTILVENLGYPNQNINSASDYSDFCTNLGIPMAGREVENPASWLAQKRMLWNSNHELKQNNWPDSWVVNNQYGGSLAMPMYRTSDGLVSIFDNAAVILPDNLVGDQCDPGGDEYLCGYWYSNGWSDSNLSVYPDPEDWGSQYNHSETYISCLFR